VDETTVWMVPLRRGNSEERRGVLSLEERTLVFVERRRGERVEIPLERIRKARRVRGSPILMVSLRDDSDLAFYFAQPPPLNPPRRDQVEAWRALRPFGSTGESRRGATKRAMRTNIKYLSSAATGKREEIQAWVRAIRDAMKRA
jgi:hypothetical protein